MDMKVLWEHIAMYYRHGLNVIPVKPNTKEPMIYWTPYQTKRATKEELKKWFRGPVNVAVIVGPTSQVAVIDADTPKAVELLDSIDVLSRTTQVKTKRGKHYHIKVKDWSEDFNYLTIDDGKEVKVEVKFNKSCAMLPPSIVNGHQYVFINGLDKMQEMTAEELKMLVKDICKMVLGEDCKKQAKKKTQSVVRLNVRTDITTGLEGDSFEQFKQYILTNYKPGKRHFIVLGLAGTLRKAGLSKDMALSIVMDIVMRAKDEEVADRIYCVETTYEQNINQITGIRLLRKLGYNGKMLRALLLDAIEKYQMQEPRGIAP